MRTGILGRAISSTPIAVIDFETTGLDALADRVVEVSVVRVEPGGRKPALALDTLVNPGRRVAATHIHGVTDGMVRNAPCFSDVWPVIRRELSDCVVAAYNASFDMRFLTAEVNRLRGRVALPYVCLRNIRSLIGIGQRCGLSAACREHGIRLKSAHRSAHDAMAAARLIPDYLETIDEMGVTTFGELAQQGSHTYLRSFRFSPIPPSVTRCCCELCPRERV